MRMLGMAVRLTHQKTGQAAHIRRVAKDFIAMAQGKMPRTSLGKAALPLILAPCVDAVAQQIARLAMQHGSREMRQYAGQLLRYYRDPLAKEDSAAIKGPSFFEMVTSIKPCGLNALDDHRPAEPATHT